MCTTTQATTTPVIESSANPSEGIFAWYLGGNVASKLLTSVDGDLDSGLLSKLEQVPKPIGELALSVESLVSDDLTSGGFEHDILEKIASNIVIPKPNAATIPFPSLATTTTTTTASTKKVAPKRKRASAASAAKKSKKRATGSKAKNSLSATTHQAMKATPTPPLTTTFVTSVPNPLAGIEYEPVPNPLAPSTEVTPPPSPSVISHQAASSTAEGSKVSTSSKTKKVRRVVSAEMVSMPDAPTTN